MVIGAVIVNVIHGWLNSKGMEQAMLDAENVNMKQSESNAGIHTQNLWAMLSEHTLERCKNCGGWKHDPLPCTTCLMWEIRQRQAA